MKRASWECIVPEIRAVLDPGGLAVDHLRRPYVEWLPLVRGSKRLYPVRWFHTDLPDFPLPTPFVAQKVWHWDKDLHQNRWPAFWFYQKGPRYPVSGVIRGSEEDWLFGVQIAEPCLPRLGDLKLWYS